jgi:hypothetical protein
MKTLLKNRTYKNHFPSFFFPIVNIFSYTDVLGGNTLWYLYLQMFLQCIKYIIFEFTPSVTLLYPSTPIPGAV